MVKETYLHEACCDLIADVARISGKVQLRVAGTSMIPILRPGDVVVVRRCQLPDLVPRSLVMFQRRGGLVVHRMIERSAGHIITRGDAIPCMDEPVSFSDVIGRVEAVIRNGWSIDPKGSFLDRAIALLFRHSQLSVQLYLKLSIKMSRIQMAEFA